MRAARWLLLIPAVPVAALVVAELVGDWALGVRVVRPDPPPEPAPALSPDTPADPTAASAGLFLQSLATAVRDGRASAADGFDADRFHAAVARSATFRAAGIPTDPVGGPVRARVALVDAVRAGGPGLAADAVEVRRVVPGTGADEFVVAARHRLGGRAGSYRWWLVRTPDGWKAFDLEDVRTGARLSRQAAVQ
ncbi:hypothetical protein J0H58_17410, partial [bacterium]|nr:hypothetical protein [bacterium]